MSTEYSPTMEVGTQGSASVWRLSGEWTRDLSMAERRDAARLLSGPAAPEKLVLDLTNISFIDSWGEENVCDAVQRVQEEGGAVVWTFDSMREAEYQGLVRTLERRQLSAAAYSSLEQALKAAEAACA